MRAFDDPQYEIKSDKTDHVALHKGTALKLIGRVKSYDTSERDRG